MQDLMPRYASLGTRTLPEISDRENGQQQELGLIDAAAPPPTKHCFWSGRNFQSSGLDIPTPGEAADG
jgi:hypothetical protein